MTTRIRTLNPSIASRISRACPPNMLRSRAKGHLSHSVVPRLAGEVMILAVFVQRGVGVHTGRCISVHACSHELAVYVMSEAGGGDLQCGTRSTLTVTLAAICPCFPGTALPHPRAAIFTPLPLFDAHLTHHSPVRCSASKRPSAPLSCRLFSCSTCSQCPG
ncbi:uncharacterized protein SCHCODRAFT_02199997 [Schizophyllum commune H4-8]|uniref:uncharacterized protein n=1 Tax=Schizophyllum commune (strain H4-8 / FGSC 9210) TaxID=578458 RepID=UPI002160BF23|nr:uncharacterized protein SCHCODRAFT_02199997 [Schizophyllum commune H4-8]KAI5896834.1 hypothetical protein SCHCODRAFT_02199997 [Schizophyllum commune H4-8]